MTIERTFSGTSHIGYTVTNEHGAVAEVYASKRSGYFVRTETNLFLVNSLLTGRDLAIELVA